MVRWLSLRNDRYDQQRKLRVITGANGFIGKNLCLALSELDHFRVITYLRNHDISDLSDLVSQADYIIHLAGENRPLDESEYAASMKV